MFLMLRCKSLIKDQSEILKCFLPLLGRYGIIEILLFFNQFVDCRAIFEVLPLDIFMSIGRQGWR